MNKRNFNFYLSKSSHPILNRGWEVDNNGKFSNTGDTNKWVYGLGNIRSIKGFYFDFDPSNNYHAILFFDASKTLVGNIELLGNTRKLIMVPDNTVYFCVRLTSEDSAFEKARTSDFIFSAYQVSPYYKKLEKKLAKAAEQEYYTESLAGQIKLVGKDFDLVYDSILNTRFLLTLIEAGTDSNTPYYNGVFNKTNCKFDYFKKTCEPKIQTLDPYKVVLDKYKDKFNLVKLGVPTSRVICTKRPFVQIYIEGSDSITNVFNGQPWDVDVSAAPEGKDEIIKYGFGELKNIREIRFLSTDEALAGLYSNMTYSSEVSNQQALEVFKWYKVVKNQTSYIIIAKRSQAQTASSYSIGLYKADDLINPIAVVREPHKLPGDVLSNIFNQKGTLQGLVFSYDPEELVPAGQVDTDILYEVFGRIVHNNADKGQKIQHDDFAAVNTKAYKYCTSLSENDIKILQSADSTKTETPYGVNDYSEYFTPEFLPALPADSHYMPVGRNTWANSSLWLAYSSAYFDSVDLNYSTQFVLRDAYSISDVVNALLKAMGSSVTHTLQDSSFLMDPRAILPGTDFFRVFITQKTNMIYGAYDQAAQKVEISLEMVMNMLRDCFRCYWYIANNVLKIEHVSYFINGRSYSVQGEPVDLTILTDSSTGKPALYGQGEIDYDVSGLSRKYKFSYGDESLSPFTGAELSVKASYIQEDKTEDISVNDFSADVDFMQMSADQVSQDGFALLCAGLIPQTADPNDYLLITKELELVDANRKAYKTKVQNALASWAELVKLYSWDMPAQNVECNILPQFVVNGTKPIKQQSVRIPFYSNLVPFDRVETGLLSGQIESIAENIETGFTTLEVKGQD